MLFIKIATFHAISILMKFTIFIILLCSFTIANAFRRDNIHFPIMAFKAQSLGEGNYGYVSYPGSNATSSIFSNAYMFGITDNFDFGVIPLFYTLGGGFFNTTYRYQILNKRNHQVSLSLTHIRYSMGSNQPSASEVNKDDELMSSYSFEENKATFGATYNYTPQSQLYNFAVTINYKRKSSNFDYYATFMNARLNKNNSLEYFRDYLKVNKSDLEEIFEAIVESNYYIKRKTWLGVSIGSIRRDNQVIVDEENHVYDQNQLSLGANISYQGNIASLSNPSIGLVHFSKEQQNSIMFSTNF